MKYICFVVLVMCGVACSSDPEEVPEQSDTRFALPLDRFCDAWVDVQAQQSKRCGRGAQFATQRAEIQRFCEKGLLHSVQEKIITYDPHQATSCLLTYQDTCSINAIWTGCNGAFTGVLQPGDRCYFSQECAQGRCDPSAEQCAGFCSEVAQPGGSCAQDPCPQGTYCDLSEICAKERGLNELCRFGECEQDLFCYCGDVLCENMNNTDSPQGRCLTPLPRGELGERCNFDRMCSDGLFCFTLPDSEQPLGHGICRPVSQPGERCEIGGDDLTWVYDGCEGALCHVAFDASQGVCRLSEEGSPCARVALPGDVYFDCIESFVCNEEGRCERFIEPSDTEDGFCVRP